MQGYIYSMNVGFLPFLYRIPGLMDASRAEGCFSSRDETLLKTKIISIDKQLKGVIDVLGTVEAAKQQGASPEGIAVKSFVEAMKQLRQLPIEALFFAKPWLHGVSLQDRVARSVRSLIEVLHTRVYGDLASKRYFNDLRYCLRHVPEVVLNAHTEPKDRTTVLDHLAMLGVPKHGHTVPFRQIIRGQQFSKAKV